MKIDKNKVVSLNYTLKDNSGAILDTSEGREPLVYLHGVGGLIPGLEQELNGKETGENLKSIVIEPEAAYGERHDDLIKVVPKSGFQGDEEMQVGMKVQLDTPQGPAVATISNIEAEDITLDLNHPLAGETLHFDVEVVEVREATADELSQGNTNAPTGNQQ